MKIRNFPQKNELLQERNYEFCYLRQVYYNEKEKKVFTIQVLIEKSPDWIRSKMEEKNKSKWGIYSLSELSLEDGEC